MGGWGDGDGDGGRVLIDVCGFVIDIFFSTFNLGKVYWYRYWYWYWLIVFCLSCVREA